MKKRKLTGKLFPYKIYFIAIYSDSSHFQTARVSYHRPYTSPQMIFKSVGDLRQQPFETHSQLHSPCCHLSLLQWTPIPETLDEKFNFHDDAN